MVHHVGYNIRGLGVVWIWPLNLLNHIHTLNDTPKKIKRFFQGLGIVSCRNKELAAVGISAAICHSDNALCIVAPHGFVFELIAWTAGTSTLRVAALDHEAGYHAMEFQSIIKVAFRQEDEIVDRHRRVLWIKLDHDQAAIGV